MTRARDIASLLDSGGDIVRSALDNAELVDDTSPELAADLDVLTSSIVSSSNRDITITPDGTGSVVMSKVDINSGAIDGVTIGSAVAGGSTFSSVSTGTLSATLGADFNNIHIENNAITSTNANGNIALTPIGTGEVDISNVDIDAGAIDGVTLGTNSAVTEAQIDNININGNAIISTDTDGNIAITPNGTGEVDISKVDIDAGTIDGVTIGGSSAGAGTFTTLSATTLGSSLDLNSQALTNANIDSGAIDGVTLGTNSAVTQAQIDNINIDANSIISTNTNGNIILTPNGTGNVTLGTLTFDADQTVGVGQDDYVLTYDNATGTIGLETPASGGGGILNVVDDLTPQLGGPLDVNGQAIVSVSNGNIALTPNGTGEVDISKVDIDSGAIDGTTIGAASAAAGTFTTLSATTLGSAVDLNNQALTNADINSGAIDGTSIGASSAAAGTFTTLSATTLGSAVDLNNQALTNANIDSGAIDGTTIGAASAASGTFTSLTASGDLTVDTDTLYVDSTNNRVGVGTTSPSVDFEIDAGSATGTHLQVTTTGSGHNIDMVDLDSTARIRNVSGYLRIGADHNNESAASRVQFEVDGTEVARFTNTGDFWVGTTSGTINSSNFGFTVASSGFTAISRDLASGGNIVRIYGNAGEFRIKGDGDAENTNNSYGAISDQTVKENISDASSQWDDIKALQVRKFSLIQHNLEEANQIGVIAQELEAAGMGGLVKTNDDGLKSVKYSVLYMKAVKALQEAQTRIEDLEARISALEGN